jgi:hypothetical protein
MFHAFAHCHDEFGPPSGLFPRADWTHPEVALVRGIPGAAARVTTDKLFGLSAVVKLLGDVFVIAERELICDCVLAFVVTFLSEDLGREGRDWFRVEHLAILLLISAL